MFVLKIILLSIEGSFYLFLSALVVEGLINKRRERKRIEHYQWQEWLMDLGLEETASIVIENIPKSDMKFVNDSFEKIFARWT